MHQFSQQSIFLSGGAGFIGTALAGHFLNSDNRVIVYDSFVRNTLQYFPDIMEHPNLELVQGDIRDLAKLERSVKDADYVFHLAAIAGVSKYFSIPAEVMEVNVIGTYNMLKAVTGNQGIKAFFDFSTSEIYGSSCFNAREDGDVRMENLSKKRWTYATSKIASEKLGMSFFWQYGVPFIAIRPFNVYGPGQVGEGVISYFLNNAIQRRPLNVTGDGSQCRTFCYIDDLVRGTDCILTNLETSIGQSFNIGRSREIISMHSLAKLVREVTGANCDIKFVEHKGEDVMVRSPNVSKLEKLSYSPRVGLREGLQRTFEWYKKNNVTLD